jgi:hypothetical protein
LNVQTGQLISRQRSIYPVQEMARFFRFVDQHYPTAERIFLVLDNWFVHLHPYDDDCDGLKQAVEDWLAQYTTGSQDLLRSVSLLP